MKQDTVPSRDATRAFVLAGAVLLLLPAGTGALNSLNDVLEPADGTLPAPLDAATGSAVEPSGQSPGLPMVDEVSPTLPVPEAGEAPAVATEAPASVEAPFHDAPQLPAVAETPLEDASVEAGVPLVPGPVPPQAVDCASTGLLGTIRILVDVRIPGHEPIRHEDTLPLRDAAAPDAADEACDALPFEAAGAFPFPFPFLFPFPVPLSDPFASFPKLLECAPPEPEASADGPAQGTVPCVCVPSGHGPGMGFPALPPWISGVPGNDATAPAQATGASDVDPAECLLRAASWRAPFPAGLPHRPLAPPLLGCDGVPAGFPLRALLECRDAPEGAAWLPGVWIRPAGDRPVLPDPWLEWPFGDVPPQPRAPAPVEEARAYAA